MQNNPMQSKILSKFRWVGQQMGWEAASAFVGCGYVVGHALGGNGRQRTHAPQQTTPWRINHTQRRRSEILRKHHAARVPSSVHAIRDNA
jgi:hypothetical protein